MVELTDGQQQEMLILVVEWVTLLPASLPESGVVAWESCPAITAFAVLP